ncbi:alpha-amylase family glycosyl hydrolase [Tautonia rosea]|uniref:alpha-amylase family glycosyl hydrolase n=1 Tax=Tautonia rosea TaxID=2728037 RepID=UPI0014727542|nr:alpha-amylase family glycosyl hydrolase [Tautonia rosea]
MSRSWAQDAFFTHIYPLGQCGAEPLNDFRSPPIPRLDQLRDWIGHLRALGSDALYLGPVFESSSHGYDTADYRLVDRRLGTDDTLAGVTAALHDEGIRVILDGVFHHVGRDFWAFRDLQQQGEQSAYRDWFSGVNFSQRSPLGDPFSYDAWEGHFDLVKLNLGHPAVRDHLFNAIRSWVDRFAIDGLRLDVAYALDPGFLRALAEFCRSLHPDFWLLGEAIHGDYRRIAGPGLLDAVTNYECYKGLYSSHNDRNLFEIAHSLDRQFGDGGLYRNLTTYNFVDNHDVDRIASTLREPAHLDPIHLLLFTMPGVPAVYSGSEWGIEGARANGDDRPLRPPLPTPEAARTLGRHPDLAPVIAQLATIRRRLPPLRQGSYRQLLVASEHLAFERPFQEDRVIVAINAAGSPASLELPVSAPDGEGFEDQLDPGKVVSVLGGRLSLDLPPRWGRILARPGSALASSS